MHEEHWRNRLEGILGAEGVATGADWLREGAWEGSWPKALAAPATRDEVREVLRLASAERLKVAPAGSGTKQRLGGIPQEIDLVLSLARLDRIPDYPASDLTISVEAGREVDADTEARDAPAKSVLRMRPPGPEPDPTDPKSSPCSRASLRAAGEAAADPPAMLAYASGMGAESISFSDK